MNDETDNKGMYDYFASHALISDEQLNKVHKHCDFSPDASASKQCVAVTEEIDNTVGSIDIYNIYAPMCFNTNLTTHPKKASVSV